MDFLRYKEVRQYQVSLILIGIALGMTKEDRKDLFDKLDADSIKSPRARRALEAISKGDRDGVFGFLGTLGIRDEHPRACDAIIDRLHELMNMNHVADALQVIMNGSLVDGTAEERLEKALQLVRNIRHIDGEKKETPEQS